MMSSVQALLADREGVRGGGMSSKFKGVSWDRKNLKWKAQICIYGNNIEHRATFWLHWVVAKVHSLNVEEETGNV